MNIIETAWNWNGSLSKRAKTTYIALHHAQAVTCSAADVDSWHKSNGWCGIGYHFFVCKNGDIYRGRPIWALGAHVSGMNNCSIGVCAEGSYEKEKTMPDTQKTAIKELLKYLKKEYPDAKIVGHREIGESDCPGKYYPLEEMKNCCNESEEIDMEELAELKAELAEIKAKYDTIINKMGAELEALRAADEKMIYNYIDDNMPEWARDGVQWCVDNGIITGTGDGLGLDDKDLKYCTIIKRLAAAVKA
jgi:N-acetyl-anhydromuramyl-L-alanine amidase AmpD